LAVWSQSGGLYSEALYCCRPGYLWSLYSNTCGSDAAIVAYPEGSLITTELKRRRGRNDTTKESPCCSVTPRRETCKRMAAHGQRHFLPQVHPRHEWSSPLKDSLGSSALRSSRCAMKSEILDKERVP